MKNNNISSIQIMGDIHSGTRWLYSLLSQNLNQLEMHGGHKSDFKHDHFSTCLPKKDVLYIYSIRTYESWLPRMKVQNYGHYLNMENIAIYDIYCNKILSNFKILQELNFICARLDVLQKDQGAELLTTISKKFNVPVLPNFKPITKHTKSHAQWWRDANKSPQPNYNFDHCNNNLFESLLNKLQSKLLFNVLC